MHTGGKMNDGSILIIGAGLGGAALGLGLARRGFRVRVFEQSPALGEVGAGLTVPVSAMRALYALGVGEAVRAHSEWAAKQPMLHYQTASVMAGEIDDGADLDDPTAWTTRHMLRADLHSILIDALRSLDPEAIALDHRLTAAEVIGDGVTAAFANGVSASGQLLIGCDGLRSVLRAQLFEQRKPTFTGQVTWRCLVPMEVAAPFMTAGRSAIYIGPSRFFNRYTVRGKRLVNCVATAKTNAWKEEGWSVPSTIEEFKEQYRGWHPDVIGLIEHAPQTAVYKWALYEREPLTEWTRGRIALLGDAAHPMLPFLGIGAALAIEDAVVLSMALGDTPDKPEFALKRFEQARIERATTLFHAARRQGEAYQADDPYGYIQAQPPAVANRPIFDYDPTTALV